MKKSWIRIQPVEISDKFEQKVIEGLQGKFLIQAIRHNAMYMEDYIKQLDSILSGTGEKLLERVYGYLMKS